MSAHDRASLIQSIGRGCLDSGPDSDWSCIEGDGTGLWCDACLAAAEDDDASHAEEQRRHNLTTHRLGEDTP
jgi:hypothetical protein